MATPLTLQIAARVLRRRRRRRAPRVEPPPSAQRVYARALLALVASVARELRAELDPVLRQLGASQAEQEEAAARREPLRRSDVDPPTETDLRRAFLRAELVLGRLISPSRFLRLLRRVTTETGERQRRGLRRQLRALVGIDVTVDAGISEALLARFTAENVSLIRSLGQDTFDQVEDVVLTGWRSGRRAASIAKDLTERVSVGESRAALIARDQVEKLYSRVTEERQRDLGIQRYVWSTSRDERVRPSHRELEGQEFAWDAPPPEGHPGFPINCRCVALPVVEDPAPPPAARLAA